MPQAKGPILLPLLLQFQLHWILNHRLIHSTANVREFLLLLRRQDTNKGILGAPLFPCPLNMKDKILLWQTTRFTNNVLVYGNNGTRCSNSPVQALKTLCWRKCFHKKGKCHRGNSEPHAKEAILSSVQDSLLCLVVYDLASVTGASSLPIKPI